MVFHADGRPTRRERTALELLISLEHIFRSVQGEYTAPIETDFVVYGIYNHVWGNVTGKQFLENSDRVLMSGLPTENVAKKEIIVCYNASSRHACQRTDLELHRYSPGTVFRSRYPKRGRIWDLQPRLG
jgi:hypothetical protein